MSSSVSSHQNHKANFIVSEEPECNQSRNVTDSAGLGPNISHTSSVLTCPYRTYGLRHMLRTCQTDYVAMSIIYFFGQNLKNLKRVAYPGSWLSPRNWGNTNADDNMVNSHDLTLSMTSPKQHTDTSSGLSESSCLSSCFEFQAKGKHNCRKQRKQFLLHKWKGFCSVQS